MDRFNCKAFQGTDYRTSFRCRGDLQCSEDGCVFQYEQPDGYLCREHGYAVYNGKG